MSEKPILLWLDDPRATDATLVGPKAARLAMMRQAGMPVPAAFVLTTHLFSAGMSDASKDVLRIAYNRLLSTPSPSLPFSASPPLDFTSPAQPLPVAVRSSATAEDLDGASFAGMQDTVLNVVSQEQMLAAVRRVWESVESPEARAYRERAGVPASAMAVLVQQQVAATVAGVAFASDPITGEDVMVIEAVAGLGEALVSGKTEPQRWQIHPNGGSGGWDTSQIVTTAQAPLLREAEVSQVVALVAQACDFFGEPQDVEWAWDDERLWMLQSRPITTSPEDWFTDHLPNDDYLWTAAFLNERFTQPVSPLGWSMIAKPLARLALRGPLELLGAQKIEGPLLKLWRGHPYSRVEAWQRIYKLFPDAILPEDAERYFPEGDTSLRNAPRHPTFGVHLFLSGLRVLKQDFGATSPLHNPQAWARYERRQAAALIRFRFAERQLARHGNYQAAQAATESAQAPTENAQGASPIPAARRLLQEVADLTDELLNLHRWSLLYADLSYSLLRRLLIMRYGASEGAKQAVQLTAGVSSPTTRMNASLAALAAEVNKNEPLRACLIQLSHESAAPTAPTPNPSPNTRGGESFFSPPLVLGEGLGVGAGLGAGLHKLRDFIEKYGHRFFSLDFYDAPWEADIPGFARFLLMLCQNGEGEGESENENEVGKQAETPTQGGMLALPLRLTRAYLRLREAQRFHWQQLLALQRRVVLVMGDWWAKNGQLVSQEHVFGLTWDELMTAQPNAEQAAARMKQLHRLRKEAQQAPGWHYPDFLRGNEPLGTSLVVGASAPIKGKPVSPGIARGPARLITHPSDFERLRPGDILVTTSPDPGWTPIFGTAAGMVTERGGQLSHGAVVAREYHLPAVSGIRGLLKIVHDGEMLLVDGTQGLVVRLENENEE